AGCARRRVDTRRGPARPVGRTPAAACGPQLRGGGGAMSLKNQRILIVGGGSGIGYAVAEACIAEGAQVTVASSHQEKVDAAASRLGSDASAARIDVTEEGGVQAFFAA